MDTTISANMKFTGSITLSKNLINHGHIDGKILGGQKVEISPSGEVLGEIQSENVYISGKFQGNISETNYVHIANSSLVQGEIHTKSISVEKGGHIHGNIFM